MDRAIMEMQKQPEKEVTIESSIQDLHFRVDRILENLEFLFHKLQPICVGVQSYGESPEKADIKNSQVVESIKSAATKASNASRIIKDMTRAVQLIDPPAEPQKGFNTSRLD